MKGFVKANIFHHLRSLIPFPILTKTKFHWLLLLSSAPVLLNVSAVVSQTTPQKKIAQVLVENTITRPVLKIGSKGQPVKELQAALKLLGLYPGSIDGIYSNTTAAAVSQFQQAAGLKPDGVVDLNTWQQLFPGVPSQTNNVSSNTVPLISPSTSQSSVTPVVNNTTSAAKPTTSVQPAKPPANSTLKPSTPPKRTTAKKKPAPQKTAARSQRENTPKNTSSKPKPVIQYTAQGYPILRPGMRGSEVVKLQKKLSNLGFLKSGVDGDYGPLTENAVKAFQKRNGLEDDGVVGGATWNILMRR